jgi:hypothetical protein
MSSTLYYFANAQCYRTTVYGGAWGKAVKTITSPSVKGK